MEIPFHSNTVYFAKVRETAKIPSKLDENGCYDIYADFEENELVIHPHETAMIPTGIASAFSPKYRFNSARERGSTGTIGMLSLAGQIDSGYRGEWFVLLHNSNDRPIVISKLVDEKQIYITKTVYPYSKAICQAALEEVPMVVVEEISFEKLQEFGSNRGTGKLGSSGK